MEAGLDTGPMLLKMSTPILATDTGGSLHDRLASLGPDAVLQTIQGLLDGSLAAEQQLDGLATYAHKLNKQAALIDWQRPAAVLDCQIRAMYPWPICHSTLAHETLKIHAAQVAEGQGQPGEILSADRNGLLVACGEQALRLTHLQLPNGKALAFSDLLNGKQDLFQSGQVLGL
jgi:methionyl-tRNA formyltransferase